MEKLLGEGYYGIDIYLDDKILPGSPGLLLDKQALDIYRAATLPDAACSNAQHPWGGSLGSGTAIPWGTKRCVVHGPYLGPSCPTCTSAVAPQVPWTPNPIPATPVIPQVAPSVGSPIKIQKLSSFLLDADGKLTDDQEFLLAQGAAIDVVTGEMYQGPWKPFPGRG